MLVDIVVLWPDYYPSGPYIRSINLQVITTFAEDVILPSGKYLAFCHHDGNNFFT
jgi:hypothetical protein